MPVTNTFVLPTVTVSYQSWYTEIFSRSIHCYGVYNFYTCLHYISLMLLDVWKTETVDSCFHLSFTRLIFQSNSSANAPGGTKYICFKQVVPARSRWFQLVIARSLFQYVRGLCSRDKSESRVEKEKENKKRYSKCRSARDEYGNDPFNHR